MHGPDVLLLEGSSRAAIERSAGLLVPELRRDRWLPESNQYREKYPAQLWAPDQRGDGEEVALYMAATVPIHCVDGWAYLGRAMQAQLRGDPDAATHLGYYAELRAAMTILASEGVGIFNTVQLVVDDDNAAATLSERDPPWGTHAAIWPILNQWGQKTTSHELLGEIIRFGDQSLNDWLQATEFMSNLGSVGRDLLQRWGLDLSRLASDRDARNLASYYPTTLCDSRSVPAAPDLAFVRDAWTLLEPESSSPFELMDGNLLRLTLRQAAGSVVVEEQTRENLLAKRVEKAIKSLGISELRAPDIASFLTEDAADQPPLVTYAEMESEPGEPTHHLEVLSRAILLLRLATGACRLMLLRAGITARSLEWWWRDIGGGRALWDQPPDADALMDQWQDIADAIGDLDLEGQADSSRIVALDEFAEPLSRLAGMELVPLWSLPADSSVRPE